MIKQPVFVDGVGSRVLGAAAVRDYLINKFQLDPQTSGAMPLGGESTGSPGGVPWNGVALAVILPKGALAIGKETKRGAHVQRPSSE